MSKQNLEKALRQEIEILNNIIDYKIIKGLSYTKEAKRHKFLLLNLTSLRRESKVNWLGQSFSII